ncbi:hypothetical protein [Paenibacillus sp. FSL L8-0709]|uniref:hypothetical protein n=1 Tax=Paenibacillus sp. FSL L8-0709 TaxID=2975312 RepID=UPI0030FBEA55
MGYLLEDRVYTLDYLADIFGINIKYINEWVEAGRFRGVDWGKHKYQVRIPVSAMFILLAGEEVPIQKVIDRYLEIQKENEVDPNNMDKESYNILRTIEVSKLITFYDERYNGTYEFVLKEKGNPNN